MFFSQVEIRCNAPPKKAKAAKFMRNKLLHPLSREKVSDVDSIRLCSFDQSKFDYCFGADQCTLYAIKRDKTTKVLF